MEQAAVILPSAPPDRRLAWGASLAAALFAVLVAALAGLVVAFAISARGANRQFLLASLSERQAAAVARIVALAPAGPGPALDRALIDYRALIAAETREAGGETDDHQRRELARAEALANLAQHPDANARLQALAHAIDAQERGELQAGRAALARAGQQSMILAGLLAAVALACAGCGAWLLWRSNRALAAMVRARTARIEAVDASRRLFFAKASHELRTPVAALRSAAEVALDQGDADPAFLRETLGHVVAQAGFLTHRIEELLGLASADDGRLALDDAPFDLGAVVAQAVAAARSYAASVDVTIELAAPGAALPMQGDARWLRQALLAVIENGLKFAPMDSALAVCLTPGKGTAQITVSDRGPGVMESDLPRIFDAYYQAQEGRQRGGSGLGLALARWVVEQHGGTVVAENQPAGGCLIRFCLPLQGHRA
ncbi:HAMP domain-containing sensor histidine kinase [Novosphingobium sp. SG720]|uniref:ATP-binding protein n=1 Tax=Novosphingobium sp. SG720 TaxID=2586998 RepID=UPI0014479A99|nr:signal transduction histidine kinase [Novosphingobium sp. SG720]